MQIYHIFSKNPKSPQIQAHSIIPYLKSKKIQTSITSRVTMKARAARRARNTRISRTTRATRQALTLWHKKKDSLRNPLNLRGGYLRLPMSQTIGVVRLNCLSGMGREGGTITPWHKKRGVIADSSLRGRLPTLPLSQYHRRGEA